MNEMRLLHSRPPYNFMGVEDSSFEKSKVVVLPVPYDSTVSYRAGARDGPHAIISASRNLEVFDEELETEPYSLGFYTLDELEPSMKGPEQTMQRIEGAVEKILEAKKFPLMLGGEHSISIGGIRPCKRKYKELTVLQFDAHPDLRDEYEDSEYNHACVMHRAFDAGCKIVQVGLRSIYKGDYAFIKANPKRISSFFMRDREKWGPKEIAAACTENVYISFDLDAFDSSAMPSVGTPEPGGLHFREVLQIIREVSRKRRIVGADVVELAPTPGLVAPDVLAAKLAYKIAAYAFARK